MDLDGYTSDEADIPPLAESSDDEDLQSDDEDVFDHADRLARDRLERAGPPDAWWNEMLDPPPVSETRRGVGRPVKVEVDLEKFRAAAQQPDATYESLALEFKCSENRVWRLKSELGLTQRKTPRDEMEVCRADFLAQLRGRHATSSGRYCSRRARTCRGD